ncbi:hypothetical protein [Chryseobacterium sp. 2VB]|uniref:hypothetical protein n=1 Tax=Chryseobacterium sp. 2VB TaxID=2502204 RepID=UPI0010F6174D|nr:hypothetical protein [Chryseobacterium sp. 2VB]
MKNTLENKAKFFAQYCGQRVLSVDEHPDFLYKLNDHDRLKSEGCLMLTSIQNITEEDALTYIGLGYNGYLNIIITEKHNDGVSFEYEYKTSKRRRTFSYRFNYVSQYTPNVAQLDFLRSKGYALPWMNLNIDTLEKYGWIKLKEN